MRKLFIIAVLAVASWLVVFGLIAAVANAGVGIAHGIGPHAPHPLTPHIGRVYYRSNGTKDARRAIQTADEPHTALDDFLADYHKSKHATKQVKCDKMHAQYIARHGFTTPTPLKGYTGCAKYSRDEAYWQTRRGTRNTITSAGNQVAYTVHDSLIW